MDAPSRFLAIATAVILLAAAMPAAAAPPAALPSSGDLPIPRIFHATLRPGPDRTCDEARQADESPMLDRWRQWWSAATSRRVARQIDPDRPARAPFYLRSPMMSGFFGWGEPDGCDDGRTAVERNTLPLHRPAPLRADSDSAALSPTPQPRW